MEVKICIKCQRELPANKDYFPKRKNSKDGLRNDCRECHREYNRQQREKNKGKIQEYQRNWYQDNKEVVKARAKKYYENNKEEVNKVKKEYYENNKDHLNALSRQYYKENIDDIKLQKKQYRMKNKKHIWDKVKLWRETNPEKLKKQRRKYNNIRRAKERELDATLTIEEWEGIKADFNYKCAYCGEQSDLEQEHFIPVSKNGEYTTNNIIPACRQCNVRKSNIDFFDWYPTYEHYDKKREKFILEYLGYTKNIQQLSIL